MFLYHVCDKDWQAYHAELSAYTQHQLIIRGIPKKIKKIKKTVREIENIFVQAIPWEI